MTPTSPQLPEKPRVAPGVQVGPHEQVVPWFVAKLVNKTSRCYKHIYIYYYKVWDRSELLVPTFPSTLGGPRLTGPRAILLCATLPFGYPTLLTWFALDLWRWPYCIVLCWGGRPSTTFAVLRSRPRTKNPGFDFSACGFLHFCGSSFASSCLCTLSSLSRLTRFL